MRRTLVERLLLLWLLLGVLALVVGTITTCIGVWTMDAQNLVIGLGTIVLGFFIEALAALGYWVVELLGLVEQDTDQ